jgi:hypothetical protein
VRLARATGGGVEFWTGLPVDELVKYMRELNDQIREENEEIERARRR